jgi:hypothetical protein
MTSGVVVGILPVGASLVDASFLSNVSSVDQVYHELEQISISRIHSRKMLLKQVHFTQMKMLLSEGSHAKRRANDGE